MTAYLSRVYSDRVELIVDSAMCDPETMVLNVVGPKVIVVKHLPLAIVGRGESSALAEFAMALLQFSQASSTVDETAERFGAHMAALHGREFALPNDFLIAGWSETKGPFHLHVAEPKAATALGCEPWILRAIPDFWSGGNFDDNEFYEAGFFADMFDYGLAYQGAKLMDAFRKKPVYHNGEAVCGVGGQLVMVTITAAGCAVRSLGMWNDHIGEKIDPAAPFYPHLTARGGLASILGAAAN